MREPMTKRRPFTQREHLGAGALISQAERDLTAVAMAVQDAYGLAAGEPLFRLVDRISRFKSTLDDRICSEIPFAIKRLDDGVPIIHAYYGWARAPDATLLNSTVSRARLVRTAEALLDYPVFFS
jgi:hypothetical protein